METTFTLGHILGIVSDSPYLVSVVVMPERRLISALLIFLVLLNTMGYYFIFRGLEVNNDVKMARALDEDIYDMSKAVTIRIPIVLPYQYDNPNFVRVEGKFVHNGESYRLIKQKYEGDTLTVVCMKDDQDKEIQSALSDIVNTFADSPVDTDGPSSKAHNFFIKEYLPGASSWTAGAAGWMLALGETTVRAMITDAHTLHIIQPPEA